MRFVANCRYGKTFFQIARISTIFKLSSCILYEKKNTICNKPHVDILKNAPLRACWKRVIDQRHPVLWTLKRKPFNVKKYHISRGDCLLAFYLHCEDVNECESHTNKIYNMFQTDVNRLTANQAIAYCESQLPKSANPIPVSMFGK